MRAEGSIGESFLSWNVYYSYPTPNILETESVTEHYRSNNSDGDTKCELLGFHGNILRNADCWKTGKRGTDMFSSKSGLCNSEYRTY
jgi:hypothetical protein